MYRIGRRMFVAALVGGTAGCVGALPGIGGGNADNPALGAVTETGGLRLSSPAFDDGGRIPEKYGREHANVNPPLRIRGVPADAASLTLIMDDPDAPGGTFLHWLVWNIPPSVRELPEGWDPSTAVEGTNDFGSNGYGGPQPPGETHTYRFKLYALGTTLDRSADASVRAVGNAMRGEVLAAAQLTGEYGP